MRQASNSDGNLHSSYWKGRVNSKKNTDEKFKYQSEYL